MKPLRMLGQALLAGLLLVTVGVQAAEPRDPGKFFFQESFGNFKDELATARQEGKQGVLIFFEQAECPFCHRMKTTVLNQPEIQDYYRKHFLIFTVDIQGSLPVADFQGRETTQKDFAFKEFQVRATPVIAFFNLDGKLITRYTGATSDAQEFMWLGHYVVEGHYKDTPFIRYKREMRRKASS
ncbi:thioredoxin [Acidihalobacter yilgarnensis]|uniref:Thioredoxin n=1 Tax=Acidihalobacter yilgarnensis TaxID=2819280 RepID=A0A1D8IKP5_9GAMM|nr:thioredoxin family protein [Acidihalobacter yilgarnensis]AOU97035.1 thioredoxin [Acidihalobacter yilgarnensis]